MELINIPSNQIDPFYRYKRNKVELRFVASHGGQTEILNLHIIAGQLNRDVEILVKHIKKSLNMNLIKFKDGFRLPINVNANTVDNSIEDFIRKFVICKECGNPETKNNKRNRCKACGYKNYFVY